MKRLKNWLITARHELICGRHSGFSWCCILWFVLGWKLVLKWFSPKKQVIYDVTGMRHEIWPVDYKNFYHKLMDLRRPHKDIPDLYPAKIDSKTSTATDYEVRRVKDWGMIPCPYHLWRRKRNTVLTCFHSEFMKWTPEAKAKALKEHPELCAKC